MLLVKMKTDKGNLKQGQLVRATAEELDAAGIALYEDCEPQGTYFDDTPSDLAQPDTKAETPPANTTTVKKKNKKQSSK